MKKRIYDSIIYLIVRFLIFFDLLLKKIFQHKYFLTLIHDNIENRQYYSKVILNKKVKFFCPSERTLGRVDSFFTKEPETLIWIDRFKSHKTKNIVFWDIGSNIGLYSIYAAIKFKKIEIISFEPSTSNTRTLSRNISINGLYDKIKIFSLALTNKKNIISYFAETKFSEGGSLSSFDNLYNDTGDPLKENQIKNKYNIFGTNIDDLIKNKIVSIPDYIKIDVDGIEHLILLGAQNLLKNNKLKELLIEVNPLFLKQNKTINKIMHQYGFKEDQSIKNPNTRINQTISRNIIYKRVLNKKI